ncbi:hypothetical protein AVEN_175868-1 [Araneus ventricosus]|uniref:Uncharacterized protein n=1 Tax=Araneus ventricosus TaxID=182803 RepID=A0A4Y2RCN5_ARAVE|nr:hypothetical protein AVEN_175868-1 [Araneus ventricosus]
MTRLFCEEDESMSNSSHSEKESTETLEEKSLTTYEKLEKAIHPKKKVLYCSTSKRSSLSKMVKQELQFFESTENRSSSNTKLDESLKKISPTSAKAERTF